MFCCLLILRWWWIEIEWLPSQIPSLMKTSLHQHRLLSLRESFALMNIWFLNSFAIAIRFLSSLAFSREVFVSAQSPPSSSPSWLIQSQCPHQDSDEKKKNVSMWIHVQRISGYGVGDSTRSPTPTPEKTFFNPVPAPRSHIEFTVLAYPVAMSTPGFWQKKT